MLNGFNELVQFLELVFLEGVVLISKAGFEGDFDELDVFFDAFGVEGRLDQSLRGVVRGSARRGRRQRGSLRCLHQYQLNYYEMTVYPYYKILQEQAHLCPAQTIRGYQLICSKRLVSR